jgi:DNA repair protein RadC
VRLDVAETDMPARHSDDASRIARAIFANLDADREHFAVLGLNQRNRINGFKEVSIGTLTSTLVTPVEVFTAALRLRVAAIVCVHNHPSGDPIPSPEDNEITRRIKESGEILAIQVPDHIILGSERFYSFSDSGRL